MNKDLINCAQYVVNGVICSYFDAGTAPTVELLRSNWNASAWAILSDEQLLWIINAVRRYY